MATLVLTVVGGILGGPVGAAIGAVAGQQIDNAIFKPKGREGPRLADLKVQASTYGMQIPQLFGTMRVAGSVIWATDLIERRNKSGGGKGRPSTTEYSYAVSLAVALSSRPIRGVGRIWADGNLLRGASGSFKERCTFRWYDGSADQPVDPLIASAVGMASASAFRGLGYVVLEELELASFGNRIPSLTFEVEGDAAPVDAGFIGDALAGETGRFGGATAIAGYAASGDRLRDALAPLFEADAVRLQTTPAGWRLAPAALAGAPVAIGGYRKARRGGSDSDAVERRRAPLAALPGRIRLRHYEPARDYQLGQQDAAVAGGGAREERIDLPAVLAAPAARALAQQLAAAAADGRESRIWQGDLAALALPVGGLVALDDGALWRVGARTVKGTDVQIELRRHQPLAAGDIAADPGEPVAAPDWPDAVGTVRLFDLPNLGSVAASAPRMIAAAAGSNDGWRGADLWVVPAGDAAPVPIGLARPAAALGALAEAVAAGSGYLFDQRNALVVSLVNPSMLLETVSEAMLLAGANRAMVGDELLQFGDAEDLGDGVWRLSRLLRGRAGSPNGPHDAGAPFVLLDDGGLTPIPDEYVALAPGGGAVLQWAARGSSDLSDVPFPTGAQALRPLAPVHGRARGDGEGGLTIDWVRRSRVDQGWRDEVDIGLGEGSELYRVALVPAAAGLGPWVCPGPMLALDAATVAGIPGGASLEVRQVGDAALSPALTINLS